jgi:ribosome biogenesis protein MAK21
MPKLDEKTLLKEILALGGTKDDLQFFVDSDEEMEVEEFKETTENVDLNVELAEFMRKSGFGPATRIPPDSEESEEEEEEESAEDEESGEEEKVVGNVVEKGTQKEKEQTGKSKSFYKLNSTKHKDILLQPGARWYSAILPETLNITSKVAAPSEVRERLIKHLSTAAKDLYDSESAIYSKLFKSHALSNSDRDFLSHVLKSGTSNDKISALQLLIQESPLHNFEALENGLFKNFAKKSVRREALLGVETIVALVNNGLLPERKLFYFRDEPGIRATLASAQDWLAQKLKVSKQKLDKKGRVQQEADEWKSCNAQLEKEALNHALAQTHVYPEHLIIWHFEDALKKWYFEFIQVLETLSKDVLIHIKKKVMNHLQTLLSSKPEQEQNILALLVNKMGDADKSIPAQSIHLLHKTLQLHPVMKMVIVKEVERLLWRPQVGTRAQYYAILFLNQIVLSHHANDEAVANKLVEIYFTLFETLVKTRTKEDKDMEQQTPDEKRAQKEQKEKGEEKKRWRNKGKVQAMDKNLEGAHSKILGALLTGLNRAIPFSKIDEGFDARMDSLYKITHGDNVATAIQALMLIFQVGNARHVVSDRFYRTLYEFLLHPSLPILESKHAQVLNLIYRAIKVDSNLPRIMAFLKRLLQVASGAGSAFSAASLYLVGEAFRQRRDLVMGVTTGDDSDDENFKDVVSDDEVVHKDVVSDEQVVSSKEEVKDGYDAMKRDPRFSHADKAGLWELSLFAKHFHPTVRMYAQSLLVPPYAIPVQSGVNYDPLRNHTISRFLDRFVYKNAKHVSEAQHKVMAPKMVNEAEEDKGILFHGGKKRMVVVGNKISDDLAVNDSKWLEKAEVNGVGEDEVCIFE